MTGATSSTGTLPWKPFADRRRDRELKREAVLRMAAQLFIEAGYARATLADVAERLHITKPALYHYFRSKEDILFECYRLGHEMVGGELRRIASDDGTGLAKACAYIRSYVGMMCSASGAILVRVDDRELSPEPRRRVRRWKAEFDRCLRGFIDQGITDGSIAACDAKIAAFAIGGALNGVGHWYHEGGALRPDEIGAKYAGLFAAWLSAGTGRAEAPFVTRPMRGRGRAAPIDRASDERPLPDRPAKAGLSGRKRT